MIFVMKTNSINQKHYIGMFTTSILRCIKKKTKYLQKHFTYFQIFKLHFSKYHKFLGSIQIFASSVKKHEYNNLAFEIHANKS